MLRKTITVTRGAQGMWVVAKGGEIIGTYLARSDAEASAINQLDEDEPPRLQPLPSEKPSMLPQSQIMHIWSCWL